MTAVFLEKAFWGFLALVGALILVIYRLFNSTLQKDLQINKINIKSELIKECEEKIDNKFINLESKISRIKKELDQEKIDRLEQTLDNFRKK